MLELKKIRVIVNDHEKKSIDESGDKIKDLNPGDKVQLRFQLENLFDEDYDEGEIEGEISIKLEDNDFDEDIDEEEEFTLDADQRISDEEDEIVFNFEVPITAEDKEYEFEVEIISEDDNNAKYETKLDLELEVERNDNDVRITNLILAPNEVSCYRKAKLEVKVVNFGNDKQKHASLLLFNEELGIDIRENFKLEEGISSDNDHTKEILIDLNNEIKAGDYPIEVSAYYDYNTLSYKESINLIVKDCEKNTNAEHNKETNNDSQKNNVANEGSKANNGSAESSANQLTSSHIIKTVEDPYTSFDFIIAILIIAIVLVLAIIVLFILLLLK